MLIPRAAPGKPPPAGRPAPRPAQARPTAAAHEKGRGGMAATAPRIDPAVRLRTG